MSMGADRSTLRGRTRSSPKHHPATRTAPGDLALITGRSFVDGWRPCWPRRTLQQWMEFLGGVMRSLVTGPASTVFRSGELID